MRPLRRSLALAFLLLPIRAGALQVPDLLDRMMRQGMDHLYNQRYTQAEQVFLEAIRALPSHPGSYFLLTSLYWSELTNNFDELNYDRRIERKFLAAADEAIRVGTAHIRQHPKDANGYFFRGGAYGIRGRWHVFKKEWLSAYSDGKRGIQDLKKALRLDPGTYDAYLGLGTYDYYTDVLPKALRLFTKILIRGGDRTRGLGELEIARLKGTYTRTEARLFLAGIYDSMEHNPAMALPVVEELYAEYPNSPCIQNAWLFVHLHLGHWKSVFDEATRQIVRLEKEPGDPNRVKGLVIARYSRGNALMGIGEYERALADFDAALEAGQALQSGWITMTHLRRGECYDLLERRENALIDYQTVLARPDQWGSWSEANRYMKQPFRMTNLLVELNR